MKNLFKRLAEVREIQAQLRQLGLDDHEGVQMFEEIVKKYLKTGVPTQGSIPLRGTKRTLVYTLTGKDDVPCSVTLAYDDSGI